MKYEMKDLGYQRTPTSAVYRVEMDDGSKWDVPVQVIADSRDEYYQEDLEDTIQFIRDGGLSKAEIYDWASNNMNWDDVKAWAVKSDVAPAKVDWQEGWMNGEKEIIGSL